MRIDVHNHAMPEPALDLLRREPVYGVTIQGDRISGGAHVPYTLVRSFYDPAAKLAELEAGGLEAAVVSVAPPLFYYEVDPEAGEAMCAAVNAGLRDFCAHSPDRLRWMAHVPLRRPRRAAEVLEEQRRAGCVGVEVASNVAGQRLDDPALEPFWAAAERLRLPVMIHPAYNPAHPALGDWYLQNVIGNQLETTVAIERLICAGLLDRHPQLVLVLVHAGGYFPYQAGRLRHARAVRPELAEAPADPWAYLGRLVFDTITHDRLALSYLVSRVGAENVVVGTDLPFDMASPRPWAELCAALDPETARRVAEENPARLYGFEPVPPLGAAGAEAEGGR
ncbi:MAG TPA: amidohydrolase family protein [Candidatus Dormibacteraeota bacterium]|nr:amidohydrolase family protein [Candidatus Dormibacteraeota bacterium]